MPENQFSQGDFLSSVADFKNSNWLRGQSFPLSGGQWRGAFSSHSARVRERDVRVGAAPVEPKWRRIFLSLSLTLFPSRSLSFSPRPLGSTMGHEHGGRDTRAIPQVARTGASAQGQFPRCYSPGGSAVSVLSTPSARRRSIHSVMCSKTSGLPWRGLPADPQPDRLGSIPTSLSGLGPPPHPAAT